MSFYVTLPSHANRHEFPNNQANAFKIRLPQPLRLQGGGWQVGLSAISLPDTHVNLYDLVQKDGFILSMSWDQTYPAPGKSDGTMVSRRGTASTLINDIQHLDWVVNGVSFMKPPLLTWNNDARKRPFKEAGLSTIKANTCTSSSSGKGTICSSTTPMSAIAKPTRRPCTSTPSWLSRWNGYVKLAVD